MNMNDTVARIVEIMFEDVELNEETEAIRDEVMNNCQERYTDLVNAGMAEDDAIAAVIESLRGMEEVLAPYKKKEPVVHAGEDEEDCDEQHVAFAPYLVHRIDVNLVNEEIKLEASDDDDYHITWNKRENQRVRVALVNGVLNITRSPETAAKTNKAHMEFNIKDDMTDFIKTEEGKIEINMDSISRAMKSLGEKIKLQFSNGVNIGFGTAGSEVTIQVPESAIPHVKLLTTSGDIDVQDVALTDLTITSTSGDINVDMDEDQRLERMEMHTTSGDLEVCAYSDFLNIATTSGDVDARGQYNKLSIGTISGDIDVRADVADMQFSAVSGDVDLVFETDEIRNVQGSTISGDIDIDLPDGIGTIAIHTNTRSGDVTTRHHAAGYGPTVMGNVTSMSGDITIS